MFTWFEKKKETPVPPQRQLAAGVRTEEEKYRAWWGRAYGGITRGLGQEVRVAPGMHYNPQAHNGSRAIVLRLVGINPHYLPKIKGMQVQLTAWAGLPSDHPVRVSHDGRAVVIEVPKPRVWWKPVTLEGLEAKHFIKRGAVATLGLGLQDDPKRIDFDEPAMAHVLIAGQTRSGKTQPT